MIKTLEIRFVLAAFLALVSAGISAAETIGYAEAVDRLATSCGKDIEKYCKKVALGGGRVQQCLDQNQAGVSASCKTSLSALRTLLQVRAAARGTVLRVCDVDIRRLCAGVQQGDGNLMECFYKAKRNVSPQCQRAVSDAGYEVSLASSPTTSQINLNSTDIVSSLQGVEGAAPSISSASLRQLLVKGMQDPSRASRVNRQPLSEQLGKLAQFNIAIQFDFDTARIRPDSFKEIGLMADALYHPYLQGYRFLIVGHADGKGNREYNLKLSQQRADAIREALINPFGIRPERIEAIGLGEEQLLNRANPEAAENRRVQLINIGR